MKIPMLQFITHANSKYNYLESAEEALKGGCKWIQLRMKDKNEEEIFTVALKLKERCHHFQATFIIDDQVHIAKEIKADGVHLGKLDMPPQEARKILGNGFIIGGTANTFDDILYLKEQKADYIGLGPFRFTETKKNLSPILGIDGYHRICTLRKECGINIPIVAIGGITDKDIEPLMATGIEGIALSGTILNAKNPVSETEKIIHLINRNYHD